jgi:hypothetical protein
MHRSVLWNNKFMVVTGGIDMNERTMSSIALLNLGKIKFDKFNKKLKDG